MYKPKRVLLNIYVKESIRLERIEYALKIRGISRTDWINQALREKLDRDHPETNAMSADYVPAKIPLDSAQAKEALQRLRKERETLDKALQAFEVVPAMAEPPLEAVKAVDNGGESDFWGEPEADLDMEKATAMLRRIRHR